jgi:hypothetical protein
LPHQPCGNEDDDTDESGGSTANMSSTTPRARQGECNSSKDKYYRYLAVIWSQTPETLAEAALYAGFDPLTKIITRNGRVGFVIGVYKSELAEHHHEFGSAIVGEFETREAADALIEEKL